MLLASFSKENCNDHVTMNSVALINELIIHYSLEDCICLNRRTYWKKTGLIKSVVPQEYVAIIEFGNLWSRGQGTFIPIHFIIYTSSIIH